MTITLPHRILVAPSGFKESLSANEVATAIAIGIRRALPSARVVTMPIADGGEGTARTLAAATGGEVVACRVTGPVGVEVDSHFAELGGTVRGTAVVEMAAAAGLRLVPQDQRDPGVTTTTGVGQLLVAALDRGASRVVVGCGDSGTSDGGAGALQALGVRILDADGREVGPGGNQLLRARTLDFSGLHPRLREVEVLAALNPHNVLTGPRGVARVFGPQKGASPEQVETLDAALTHWAGLLAEQAPAWVRERDFATGAGTGASGGLGAGLAAVGVRLVPRFTALIDSGLAGIDIDAEIARCDLVVTAEGAIDFQTPRGKVPAEIAARAARHGVPVLALAGSLGERNTMVHDIGIDAVAGIIPLPMTLGEAVAQGAELLTDATERTFRVMALGAAVSARVA